MTKTSDRRLAHLNKGADELGKLEEEMNKFNTWMTAASSELDRQEECLQRFEDLKPLMEKQKVCRGIYFYVLFYADSSLSCCVSSDFG